MRFFNWAEGFIEHPTLDDISERVQKLERIYWIWLLISVFVAIAGVAVILGASSDNLKLHSIGVFLALDGCIGIGVMKIWAHIKISMYRIIWDNKNRIESEIRKSEAQDI
jgi:divalent metal cation (Fe/Co/Zn/Cd) transporter